MTPRNKRSMCSQQIAFAQSSFRLSPHHRGKSGFALVIALSLMAFVLLLLLSITTLVQVESQSAEQQRTVSKARQNALLGLQIAIGEVQKHLGPDQRVSARADIQVQGAVNRNTFDQPYWVGVWADPDVIAGSSVDDPNDDPELLTWLVSGNAGVAATDLATEGYEPSTGAGAAGQVEVVGAGSLVANVNDTETVSVPRVEIGDGSGAYAYWVSDDGIKASVASSPSDYEQRVDDADESLSLLPQRTGFQVLDTELVDWQDKAAPRLKLSNLGALNIGAAKDVEGEFFHDLSAHSKGLLSDVMHGGLKLDLERVIEMNAAEFADEFLPLVDNDDRMFPNNLPSSLLGPLGDKGPRWDVLRISPQLTRNATTSIPLTAPMAGADFRPSISPVITHFQMYGYMTVESDPAGYRPRMYYLPAIVLWNPYDVAIDAPAVHLIYSMGTSNRAIQFGYQAYEYDAASGNFVSLGPTAVGEFPALFDSGVSELFNAGILFQYMRFGVPAHVYEPGRAYVFTPTEHSALVSGTAIPLSVGWRYGYGVFQDSTSTFQNSSYVMDSPASDFAFEVKRVNPPSTSDSNGYSVDGMKMRIEIDSGSRPFFWAASRIDFVNFATGANQLNGGDSSSPLLYPGNSALADSSQVANTQSLLFGVEVSMIFPELELDGFLGRTKGRLLANFNVRGQLVDRLHFPSSLGYGRDPENRSYTSTFFPGLQNSGTIEEQYSIETSDPATERHAYLMDSSQVDRAVYFYLPRGSHPFASVGDLRYIDLVDAQDIRDANDPRGMAQSGYMRNHGPSFTVGSSLADAFINFDALYQLDHQDKPYPDYSWLCNYQLWDRFYFSGINGSGALNYPLPFGGYLLDESIDVAATTASDLTVLRNFQTAASKLHVSGAFNINSTSVAAWAALFASFYGESSPALTGTQSNLETSPILTAPIQYGAPYVDGGSTASAEFHTGYRRLSEPQIQLLATAMVAEVKKRGPFISMAQFVNRSIDPKDAVHTSNGSNLGEQPALAELAADPRMMGALQAAIDTAGLNDDFDASDDDTYVTKQETRTLESEKQGLPPTTPAAMGAYMAGAPGYMNQGAMLSRLAPALSARSDTFTIRAYGGTSNPVTGIIDGTAVCEAVVQRIYKYVDSADAADVFPPTGTVNQQLGRRFEIVAFRWLDAGSL